MTPAQSVLYSLANISHYRLGNICKCLGYELCDYNQLDLSGLEKLLAVSANTDPDDTEPNGPGPNDAESTDTESNDTEPKKKRKKGPLESSSKRRCRDVSPGSPEGRIPIKNPRFSGINLYRWLL